MLICEILVLNYYGCWPFRFAVVWNPWDKKAKAMPDFGDEEYKSMLCVGAAAIEKPITLKPGEEWIGKQEISAVPSSYSSGQLDPELIRRMHTI
jgi:glucose-6-phosphate 1-epimerase